MLQHQSLIVSAGSVLNRAPISTAVLSWTEIQFQVICCDSYVSNFSHTFDALCFPEPAGPLGTKLTRIRLTILQGEPRGAPTVRRIAYFTSLQPRS